MRYVAVSDPARTGKRRVLRYVSLQLTCAAVVAIAAFGLDGWNAARSALAGGIIIACGTAVFGWVLFADRVTTTAGVTRMLYAGEVLKWLWVGIAFWLAFTFGNFSALALVSGAIAAQIGFWIGVGVIR
jgi:F0F1-type ATP synthase assembly protein I